MEEILFLNISVWQVVKVAVLFALLLYIVFALVIVKQAKIMTETLEIGFEKMIRMIAWFHLLFSFGVFILALIIL